MATTRGAFAQLLAPGLQAIMFEWLKEHPEEYSQFLEVETGEGAYTEDQVMAGLGLAKRKLENAPIEYDDPIQGGSRRYIFDTYALGWQVSKEMLDDDRYSIIKKMPGELVKGCRQVWESVGAGVLNNAFGSMTTSDGLALLHTAHPLLGGGTYANRLSPDAAFSVTSLQDILVLAENMVNDRGLKMQLMPTNLWGPPELQFLFAEVLQSQYAPYTGNNEINTVQGRLEPAVLHWLTDANNFFVSCKEHNYAKFYWRAKPETESTDDFETKGNKHSIVFRIAAGATHWNGWLGSAP